MAVAAAGDAEPAAVGRAAVQLPRRSTPRGSDTRALNASSADRSSAVANAGALASRSAAISTARWKTTKKKKTSAIGRRGELDGIGGGSWLRLVAVHGVVAKLISWELR